MSDPSSSSPRPDWDRLAALLGENDPLPTEEERREHKARLEGIGRAQADAIRRHKTDQVKRHLRYLAAAKAAAEAGEGFPPYEEWREPGEEDRHW